MSTLQNTHFYPHLSPVGKKLRMEWTSDLSSGLQKVVGDIIESVSTLTLESQKY